MDMTEFKNLEEFQKDYVEKHKSMFDSELGQNGQFDELVCIEWDNYQMQTYFDNVLPDSLGG